MSTFNLPLQYFTVLEDVGVTYTVTYTITPVIGTITGAGGTFDAGAGTYIFTSTATDIVSKCAGVTLTTANDEYRDVTVTTTITNGVKTLSRVEIVEGSSLWSASNLTATANFYEEETIATSSSVSTTDNLVLPLITIADTSSYPTTKTNQTVTLTVSTGDDSKGDFSVTSYGSITPTWTTGTGVWTATGSIDEMNEVLKELQFTGANNENGAFTVAVAVQDASAVHSDTGTWTFNVIDVDDLPYWTNVVSDITYNTNTQDLIQFATNPVFADVDSTGSAFTVQVSAQNVGETVPIAAVYTVDAGTWTTASGVDHPTGGTTISGQGRLNFVNKTLLECVTMLENLRFRPNLPPDWTPDRPEIGNYPVYQAPNGIWPFSSTSPSPALAITILVSDRSIVGFDTSAVQSWAVRRLPELVPELSAETTTEAVMARIISFGSTISATATMPSFILALSAEFHGTIAAVATFAATDFVAEHLFSGTISNTTTMSGTLQGVTTPFISTQAVVSSMAIPRLSGSLRLGPTTATTAVTVGRVVNADADTSVPAVLDVYAQPFGTIPFRMKTEYDERITSYSGGGYTDTVIFNAYSRNKGPSPNEDGTRFVVGSATLGRTYVYKKTTGTWGYEQVLIQAGQSANGKAVRMSNDGTALVTYSDDFVYVYTYYSAAWNLSPTSGSTLDYSSEDYPVGYHATNNAYNSPLDMSADGEWIVGTVNGNKLKVWRNQGASGSAEVVGYTHTEALGTINDVAISNDEGTIAVAVDTTGVRVYDKGATALWAATHFYTGGGDQAIDTITPANINLDGVTFTDADRVFNFVDIDSDATRIVISTGDTGSSTKQYVSIVKWNGSDAYEIEQQIAVRTSIYTALHWFGRDPPTVSINNDGDKIVIGVAQGFVRMFTRSGTTWTEVGYGIGPTLYRDDYFSLDGWTTTNLHGQDYQPPHIQITGDGSAIFMNGFHGNHSSGLGNGGEDGGSYSYIFTPH